MPARSTSPTRQSTIASADEQTTAWIIPVRIRTMMAVDIDSRSSMTDVHTAVRLPRLCALKNPIGMYFTRSPMERRLSSSMR